RSPDSWSASLAALCVFEFYHPPQRLAVPHTSLLHAKIAELSTRHPLQFRFQRFDEVLAIFPQRAPQFGKQRRRELFGIAHRSSSPSHSNSCFPERPLCQRPFRCKRPPCQPRLETFTKIDQTAFGAIQLEGDYEVAFHARAYLLWVTAVFGLLELGP